MEYIKNYNEKEYRVYLKPNIDTFIANSIECIENRNEKDDTNIDSFISNSKECIENHNEKYNAIILQEEQWKMLEFSLKKIDKKSIENYFPKEG